jgi:hypothetical protein
MSAAKVRQMKVVTAIRWWPPLGGLLMVLLGWAVGKGSTPLDDWFLSDGRHAVGAYSAWLLIFTNWRLLGLALAAGVAAALYRRQWRLALVMVVSPFIAVAIAEACKQFFERSISGALAYPSGHTTVMVVVMGMVVLVAGARLWAVTVAIVVSLLGMLGLAVTYHYFTDTIGALLFATAAVCVAAQVAGRVGSPQTVAADAERSVRRLPITD